MIMLRSSRKSMRKKKKKNRRDRGCKNFNVIM